MELKGRKKERKGKERRVPRGGEILNIEWEEDSSVCVVMASGGYPRTYETGFEIQGLNDLNSDDYDIAGAQFEDGNYLTSGGRVLNILGKGKNLEISRQNAYDNVDKVRFDYNYYRKDIGKN